MTVVVRGPSARTHRSGRAPRPLSGRGSRVKPTLEPTTEPVAFTMPDGTVAVVVSPPKKDPVKGEKTRDMYWRVRPRGWTKLKETSSPTWSRASAEADRLVEALTASAGDRPQTPLREAIAVYVERRTHANAAARGNRRDEPVNATNTTAPSSARPTCTP